MSKENKKKKDPNQANRMKSLGIVQFHQMKFDFLDLSKSKFKGHLGEITKNFVIVVRGYSGNGKTEYAIQMAKELCGHGKVGWMSYEQRYGADLQKATMRNKMEEHSGKFIPLDPIANHRPDKTFVEEIDDYLSRRGSPDYIFFDSLDYMRMNLNEYFHLIEKHGKNKGFIFIAHAWQNGKPKRALTDDIIFNGCASILVEKYIATPTKSRFGGFEPYVIWDEKARELNPLFFAKKEDKPKGVKEKYKIKQVELFEGNTPEPIRLLHNKDVEQVGVRAEISLKKGGNDA